MDPLVSDRDLEALELHLDGELGASESQQLCRRLEREPHLAVALDRLRAERAGRRAAWAACEPDVVCADLTARAIVAASLRQARRRDVSRFLRRLAAAAAVAVAFGGGWLLRPRVLPSPAIVTAPLVHREAELRAAGMNVTAPPRLFQVALTDDDGNIIAVQHFDDLGEARRFAEDVDRWQSRPRPAGPGQPPSSSEF